MQTFGLCTRVSPTLVLIPDLVLPSQLVSSINQRKDPFLSGAIPEAEEIDKVPLSYREVMKKLYCVMNTGTGSQGSPHFTKSGCTVLEGNVQLDEHTLARLQTAVVCPTGKKRAEIPHQREFLRLLKKTNPSVPYLRNKTLEYDTSPTRVPQQSGEGLKKKPFVLKWSTRLYPAFH